jgi:uncharacterized repeat protein (TIGR03803 family)
MTIVSPLYVRMVRDLARLLVCIALAHTVATISFAQIFETIANFNGQDGSHPAYGTLVQGNDGSLYGTTYDGGANNAGTIFRLDAEGSVTTLYSFCSQPSCADGSYPLSGLYYAKDGNFYGTTSSGGSSSFCSSGCGSVFRITPGGTLTTLYRFCAEMFCPDGQYPVGGLIQVTDGNFYGTTFIGGGETGYGTVFRMTRTGVLTTLFAFTCPDGYACPDGAGPMATLLQASDGYLYGTTIYGGLDPGAGTVFRLRPNGPKAKSDFTSLHTFCQGENSFCTDGAHPMSLLVQDDSGIYGTTAGFSPFSYGTIFKIAQAGTGDDLATLYNFCPHQTTCENYGQTPFAGLTKTSDGTLYGTTSSGEAGDSNGALFKINPGGTMISLHSFDGDDGETPYSGVLVTKDGNLYGTTYQGGVAGLGTIYRITHP